MLAMVTTLAPSAWAQGASGNNVIYHIDNSEAPALQGVQGNAGLPPS